MRKINIFILSLATIFFMSCGEDDVQTDFTMENEEAIVAYLEANDLMDDAIRTESGLYYVIEEEGNGTFPTLQNEVGVLYKLYRLNGQVIPQSEDIVRFPLRNVIAGWQEGIPKLSEGGSGKLFVPSHLAYGSGSPSSNQPLAFDVTLVEVN